MITKGLVTRQTIGTMARPRRPRPGTEMGLSAIEGQPGAMLIALGEIVNVDPPAARGTPAALETPFGGE